MAIGQESLENHLKCETSVVSMDYPDGTWWCGNHDVPLKSPSESLGGFIEAERVACARGDLIKVRRIGGDYYPWLVSFGEVEHDSYKTHAEAVSEAWLLGLILSALAKQEWYGKQ